MKILRKTILTALLAAALALTACSGLVRITGDGEKYYDRANGVTYLSAGVSYEPAAVGPEYALYGKTTLYEIAGLDPRLWLTEAYEGIGSIYYSEEIALPSLAEFGASKAYVCVEDATTLHLVTVDRASDVAAVVNALSAANGEAQLPAGGTSYHIKFTSDEWPGIYYDILYVEADNGRNYLYDRDTKLCAEAGGMLKAYLPDTAETVMEEKNI